MAAIASQNFAADAGSTETGGGGRGVDRARHGPPAAAAAGGAMPPLTAVTAATVYVEQQHQRLLVQEPSPAPFTDQRHASSDQTQDQSPRKVSDGRSDDSASLPSSGLYTGLSLIHI